MFQFITLRTTALRPHIPNTEILSLEDYRSRYAQNRLDSNLLEAHRLHPFITIWDDHEFANNSYSDGAQNHQSDEDDWEKRKAIGRKAFFEWIPIRRQPNTTKLYRSLRYGNMAESPCAVYPRRVRRMNSYEVFEFEFGNQ